MLEALEHGLGLRLVLWLQGWANPVSDAACRAFYVLGTEPFYLLALPFVYWCVDKSLGRRIALLFLLASWSNILLKQVWMRPRPYVAEPSLVAPLLHHETISYGLPSGHAQLATAVWGYVWWVRRRSRLAWWLWLYIALMGLARIAAGDHYPQDVLVGTLLGALLVAGFAAVDGRLMPWLLSRPTAAQIGLAGAVAALLWGISPGLIQIPARESQADLVAALATFLGLGAGFALERAKVGFSAHGPRHQRLLRYALGLAGIVALRLGLGLLFRDLEPELLWRFVRYLLIGLWAGVGAPWLFVRWGLATGPPAQTA